MKSSDADRVFLPSVATVIAFGMVMATYFYPRLLTYQSYSQAAQEISADDKSDILFYLKCNRHYQHSLDFYSGRVVPDVNPEKVDSLAIGTLLLVPHDCDFAPGDGFELYRFLSAFPRFNT